MQQPRSRDQDRISPSAAPESSISGPSATVQTSPEWPCIVCTWRTEGWRFFRTCDDSKECTKWLHLFINGRTASSGPSLRAVASPNPGGGSWAGRPPRRRTRCCCCRPGSSPGLKNRKPPASASSSSPEPAASNLPPATTQPATAADRCSPSGLCRLLINFDGDGHSRTTRSAPAETSPLTSSATSQTGLRTHHDQGSELAGQHRNGGAARDGWDGAGAGGPAVAVEDQPRRFS